LLEDFWLGNLSSMQEQIIGNQAKGVPTKSGIISIE